MACWITRSVTVGMPSMRKPRSGWLGISNFAPPAAGIALVRSVRAAPASVRAQGRGSLQWTRRQCPALPCWPLPVSTRAPGGRRPAPHRTSLRYLLRLGSMLGACRPPTHLPGAGSAIRSRSATSAPCALLFSCGTKSLRHLNTLTCSARSGLQAGTRTANEGRRTTTGLVLPRTPGVDKGLGVLMTSPSRYSHRGLPPHKFAPMLGAPPSLFAIATCLRDLCALM